MLYRTVPFCSVNGTERTVVEMWFWLVLYADFELLNGVKKTSSVLGTELWERNSRIEVRKQIFAGDDSCPSLFPHLEVWGGPLG